MGRLTGVISVLSRVAASVKPPSVVVSEGATFFRLVLEGPEGVLLENDWEPVIDVAGIQRRLAEVQATLEVREASDGYAYTVRFK